VGRAGADASNDGSFAWHTDSAAKSRVSQFLASAPILTATPTCGTATAHTHKSRDDLQSFGYDTPVLNSRPDSYTTLVDATEIRFDGQSKMSPRGDKNVAP
jgi:hypothetical protein